LSSPEPVIDGNGVISLPESLCNL